jgi:hypothetical protein
MKISEIEIYINQLNEEEEKFKNINFSTPSIKQNIFSFSNRIFSIVKLFILSFYDFFQLYFKVKYQYCKIKNKKIVFTAPNFCVENNGILEDRILKPLFSQNIIFINQSKEFSLNRINNQKVYNIGGVVKLFSKLFLFKKSKMKLFLSYRFVNNCILKNLSKKYEVYILWFYDLNSLSIIFSKYRKNITLIEVQHGSIINYPPYSKPAPVNIADIFYVKNVKTIEYLKNNLCLHYASEYRLIPYPKNNRIKKIGLNILYASTIEFNGFHPIFIDFLRNTSFKNLNLIIRLHPREREKKSIFDHQLQDIKIEYKYDISSNWLESNMIENLIVISPWSSSLEDAFDNNYVGITIDPVGKIRYEHLIDDKIFFYSDNIESTLQYINDNKDESSNIT